jgi:hypothetical protein
MYVCMYVRCLFVQKPADKSIRGSTLIQTYWMDCSRSTMAVFEVVNKLLKNRQIFETLWRSRALHLLYGPYTCCMGLTLWWPFTVTPRPTLRQLSPDREALTKESLGRSPAPPRLRPKLALALSQCSMRSMRSMRWCLAVFKGRCWLNHWGLLRSRSLSRGIHFSNASWSHGPAEDSGRLVPCPEMYAWTNLDCSEASCFWSRVMFLVTRALRLK